MSSLAKLQADAECSGSVTKVKMFRYGKGLDQRDERDARA